MARGYRMTARGNGEAEVLIYEDVGGWFDGVTAKGFYEDLRALGAVDTLRIRVNSMGGDVFEGLTIYRHIAEHRARKVVHVDGIAASIASVIAMAGDEILIAEAGRMMIHEASGLSWGPAAAHRAMAEQLETVTASLADVYVARTGQPAERVREMMAAETWMTAQEAVQLGFATSVVENVRIAAAAYDPQRHRHLRRPPADVAAAPPAPAKPQRAAADALLARMQGRIAAARIASR